MPPTIPPTSTVMANNRITQTRYPDNSPEQFSYNKLGQVLQFTR